MVVVLVGALLSGCQLSLQLLDLVAVRQQLIVVAVNLASPVAKCVTSVTFHRLFCLECSQKQDSPFATGVSDQPEGFSFVIYTAVTPSIRTLRWQVRI